jgi:dTDP-4-amino-4,6-dideoxygalactose transaminase
MKYKIPFNKPYLSGNELTYMAQAVAAMKISGDGEFTRKCHSFFESKYGFRKVLLTTSCTDALEMAALLLDIHPGDEVIAPAYTFVSTVNAFVLRGAKIVFVDSCPDNPNMDADTIEKLITSNTKVIVPVHYAGISCDMDKIMALAAKYSLYVVEDAAQAIDSYYKGKPLGSFGHLSAFSFHETKNIITGEGGMLVINDERFIERAEVIREKGTNRSKFFRGEVDKYGWVDVGSSYLPSDLIAAYLYAQLENLDKIQNRRKEIWNLYYFKLNPLKELGILLPKLPIDATNNAHMFYLVCKTQEQRSQLIEKMKQVGIYCVFHYLSLNKSEYYTRHNTASKSYKFSEEYTDKLVRLPLYYELADEQVEEIAQSVLQFFLQN